MTTNAGRRLWLRVSVPLRGKGRDQRKPDPQGLAKAIRGDVSVPLRGKGRDQHYFVLGGFTAYPQFPSPCGEKVGINEEVGTLDRLTVP